MRLQRLSQRTAPTAALHFPGLSSLAQRILAARGLSGPADSLTLDQLLPPDSLRGINEAASLLLSVIQQGGRILVVGDYDVDGATATALMVDCLGRHFGANVDFFIPNRFVHGYGLSPAIVADIAQSPDGIPDLLITVDNGIASNAGIRAAHALGIKVLVTDHHLPGDEPCIADVVVNPNQPDCAFPSKVACGCTVAFYVLSVLRQQSVEWVAEQGLPPVRLGDYLDLVALATVADVVPLDGNNRILVEQGLRRLRRGVARPGVLALLQAAGRDPRQLSSQDFGFVLGPRLNAAGRMDDMTVGVACLLTQDAEEAAELAALLEDHNQARKRVQSTMVDAAQQQLLSSVSNLALEEDQQLLVVWDEHWHEGVVGLVAGRLKERWHKPAIALCPSLEQSSHGLLYKGSARSIPGVHIRDLLAWVQAQHPDVMVRFGGHAMAAGLTLFADKLAAFQAALQDAMRAMVDSEVLVPELQHDGALTAAEISLLQAEELTRLGPWGQGCPVPLFVNRFQVHQHRWLGGKHLKLSVSIDGLLEPIDAIWFFCPWPPEQHPPSDIHLAYELSVNEFRGQRTVQLLIKTDIDAALF